MPKEKVYNNFFDPEIWKTVNKDNIDLMEDYLLELKQNKKSEQTIYQYKKDIMGYFCFLAKNGNNSILDLTKKDFRNFSLYLSGECRLSNARHNRILSAIRSLLTFAESEDDYEYDNNVSKRVRGLGKESVREIFFLTNEQVIKLKDELIRRKDFQKATVLMLAYDSAGRKNELAQVNKSSFLDESKSCTNKVIGKRRKLFQLVYFSGTKECAKLWLEQRGEDNIGSMWIVGHGEGIKEAGADNIYNWFMYIRELLEELEGKEMDFNVHSLRHSALQNYSKGTHYVCQELGATNGFPIEKLKLLANHSDISTTSAYLKDESIDELQNMFGIKIE
jgi:site-specific recombinase XerD